jgi:sucrose-6-phosphate hydrolase SacC (GH32 family)
LDTDIGFNYKTFIVQDVLKATAFNEALSLARKMDLKIYNLLDREFFEIQDVQKDIQETIAHRKKRKK